MNRRGFLGSLTALAIVPVVAASEPRGIEVDPLSIGPGGSGEYHSVRLMRMNRRLSVGDAIETPYGNGYVQQACSTGQWVWVVTQF